MATKIVTKNSSTASAVPTASDLVQGELAVNVADKRLFTEDNTGTIVELGTNPSTIDINAGSIDGTAIGASSASTGAFTTLTATGLTVDTNTLYVDSTNNRVGIGTSPLYPFHVQTPSDGSTGAVFRYIGGTNNPGLFFSTNESTRDCVINATGSTSANLVFSTTTERMRIDSSGNVGIGTTSPSTKLHVNTGSAGYGLTLAASSQTSGTYQLGIDSSSNLAIFDTAASSQRFVISNQGNVGIGTSSPSDTLSVVNLGSSGTGVQISSGTSSGDLRFKARTESYNGIVSVYDSGSNEDVRISAHSGIDTYFNSGSNVGIGTSSPSSLYTGANNLVVGGGSSESGMTIYSSSTTDGNIYFADGTSGSAPYSGFLEYNHSSNFFRVGVNASERMRINSSGDLLVGCTTTPSASVDGVMISRTPDITSSRSSTTSSSSTSHWIFYNANGIVGNISTTGSQTVYATSSDQRLKENIADANDAGSKIDSIQVRQYDWKADGSHQDYGMIAQELQTVAPEAVSGDADSEDMMSVDYSKLVPMLIKEIQSLRNRVAQLEE